MGFFKSIKSNITTAVIKTKLNDFFRKTEKTEPAIQCILKDAVRLVSKGYSSIISATFAGITKSKEPVTNLVTENYNTVSEIIRLCESLNTERNRNLLKDIAKTIQAEYNAIEEKINDDGAHYISGVSECINDINVIWDIETKSQPEQKIMESGLTIHKRIFRTDMNPEHYDFLKDTYSVTTAKLIVDRFNDDRVEYVKITMNKLTGNVGLTNKFYK